MIIFSVQNFVFVFLSVLVLEGLIPLSPLRKLDDAFKSLSTSPPSRQVNWDLRWNHEKCAQTLVKTFRAPASGTHIARLSASDSSYTFHSLRKRGLGIFHKKTILSIADEVEQTVKEVKDLPYMSSYIETTKGQNPPLFKPVEHYNDYDDVVFSIESQFDWSQLSGVIDAGRLAHYQVFIPTEKRELQKLDLHNGSREYWQSLGLRRDALDESAVTTAVKFHRFLAGSFELYKFFLARAMSPQEIWWDASQLRQLMSAWDLTPDAIQLTIQIGDLFRFDRPPDPMLDPRQRAVIAHTFVALLASEGEMAKPIEKRWANTSGRTFLENEFNYPVSQYWSSILLIAADPSLTSYASLKPISPVVYNYNTLGWVPIQLKVRWLDRGLNPIMMGEFLNLLEAFKSGNLKSTHADELPGMWKHVTIKPPLYPQHQMSARVISLFEYLAIHPLEKEAAVKWLSENVSSAGESLQKINTLLVSFKKACSKLKHTKRQGSLRSKFHNILNFASPRRKPQIFAWVPTHEALGDDASPASGKPTRKGWFKSIFSSFTRKIDDFFKR